MHDYRKTILIDLDGVLNEYTGDFDKDYIPPIKDGAKEFLENLSENNKQLLEYICPNGHKHEINWGRFQQGKRCPYCNGSFLHYDEIKKEFDKRGFILLSKEYKHDVSLEYICPNGHRHSILYHNFKKGHGCPECDGQYIPFENIQKEFEKTPEGS